MNYRRGILLLVLFSFNLLSAQQISQNPDHRRIAGFGSSVCSGTGDITERGGYVGQLQRLMIKKGWEVVNVSRGGDNTNTIRERCNKDENLRTSNKEIRENQYLVQQKPDYVLVGLSLANQGIIKDKKESRDSAFAEFSQGMRDLIEKCKKEGYQVVVANCYSNNQFAAEHYEATKKMNMQENSWGVAVFNFLGTIDDGQGHWVNGFFNDDWHPSYGGHKEMFLSIVPSTFAAIEKGKTLPEFEKSDRFAQIISNAKPALEYLPEDTIHSFTISVQVRGNEDFSPIGISGKKGVLSFVDFNKKDSSKTYEVFAGSEEYFGAVDIKNGAVSYINKNGDRITSGRKINDNKFHHITLTHITSLGKTALFVDSERIGDIQERVVPQLFYIGVNGKGDYKDLMIYRSALNNDEVKSLVSGNMIHSSLEIYAPLSDKSFIKDTPVLNKACSLSEIIVKGVILSK